MMEQTLVDRNGNHIISIRDGLEHDSLRLDISRIMLEQMHHGDAILIMPDSRLGAVMRIVRASDFY